MESLGVVHWERHVPSAFMQINIGSNNRGPFQNISHWKSGGYLRSPETEHERGELGKKTINWQSQIDSDLRCTFQNRE